MRKEIVIAAASIMLFSCNKTNEKAVEKEDRKKPNIVFREC